MYVENQFRDDLNILIYMNFRIKFIFLIDGQEVLQFFNVY